MAGDTERSVRWDGPAGDGSPPGRHRRRWPGLGRLESRPNLVAWTFVGPATLLVVGLAIFPAAWSMLLSTQRWDGITPPAFRGVKNYGDLATDPEFFAAIGHTVLFSSIYVPASIIGAIVLAVAMNRKIRFIGFYRTAIFVPFVASAAATGILANYIFDRHAGVVNNVLNLVGLPRQGFLEDLNQAMFVLCLIALWGGIGFNVVVYLAALQSVPPELTEAAQLDGASRFQAFRYVVLPELGPVTVFVAVWQTITALQLFDIVFTTTRGGPIGATRTIVYFIYHQAFELAQYGYGSAAAIVLFAVTMLITIGMIRYGRRRNMEAF